MSRVTRKKQRTPAWAFLEGFSVSQGGKPYLDRLRVVQTPLFGVYLHRIHGPDRDRGPHDHPWWFASLVLSGGYSEEVFDRPAVPDIWRGRERRRWSLRTLRRCQAHRITRVDGVLWTLVVTGRRHDSWRFWISGEPVDWKEYDRTGNERGALWGS